MIKSDQSCDAVVPLEEQFGNNGYKNSQILF